MLDGRKEGESASAHAPEIQVKIRWCMFCLCYSNEEVVCVLQQQAHLNAVASMQLTQSICILAGISVLAN